MKFNEYNIKISRSSRRKTLSIFIERDGTISVIAPDSMTEDKIFEVLKSKEYLIHSKLAKWKELNSGKVTRQFVNGQSFLYLGRNYRLRIVQDQKEPLLLKNGYFNLRVDKLLNAEQVFETFYKEKGHIKINERLKLLQSGFDKKPNQIRIMELQNRWASWTPKGNLNFHWKCMMAPVSVLDYVIIHELVHLKFPNHSSEFWNEVDKLMPNYREYHNWLNKYGVKMNL